jgi:hypothetical protein
MTGRTAKNQSHALKMGHVPFDVFLDIFITLLKTLAAKSGYGSAFLFFVAYVLVLRCKAPEGRRVFKRHSNSTCISQLEHS